MTGTLTVPPAFARKANVRMVLKRRISPAWLAGTWLAVTTTVSPATTVDGDTESDSLWRVAK